MNDLVKFLHEWESLTGAIVGGIFSLSVAFFVSRSARRTDEYSAAMIVISNLIQFINRLRVLEVLAKEHNIPEQDFEKWMVERLTYSRPKLSGIFEASKVRLLRLDVALAIHLEVFYMLVRDIDEKLDRISDDVREFQFQGEFKRSEAVVKAEANSISEDFSAASLHAACAEHILSNLILGRFPIFYRIRRIFFPCAKDQKSARVLSKSST